jgi:hypothetical protein
MKLNRRVTNSAPTQSHIISMVSIVRANPPFHFKIKYPVTIADLCHPTARYEAILNPGRFARICVDDEADARNASFSHRIPPTHTALSRRHSAPGRILSPPHPWVAACNMYILCASHVHIHLIFRYSPRQRARGFATPTTSNLTSAQFPQIAQDNPHHFCLHYFLFSFTSSLLFTFSPPTHVHHSFQIRFLPLSVSRVAHCA